MNQICKTNIKEKYIVLDIETTGLSCTKNRILEIAAIKVENKNIIERFDTLIDPQLPIPYRITQITGINDNMVCGAPLIENVLPELYDFFENLPIIAHNAPFDISFISHNLSSCGYLLNNRIIDTLKIARDIYPNFSNHKLDNIAKNLNVTVETAHRAMADVETLHEVFNIMLNDIENKNVKTTENIQYIYQNE